jgi:hypothetical protein
VALLLLPAWLGAADPFQTGSPSDADRARAIEIHKDAVERLREGALAAGSGDAIGFGRALVETARRIEALVETATWLPASDRDALRRTAAGLEARAGGRPQGYSPDADLAVLDRVGYRLRGGASVELVFEGSFARSRPGSVEEPVYGGHATAMGPP